jgi:hypothetical protein
MRSTLAVLRERIPDTVIFGGMIRDFALGGARDFTSDVDLVSAAEDSELFDAIRQFAPLRNKFGGYRFVAGKWRFDIWSLPQTWAFKNLVVHGELFDDLLKTTFFNIDAAYYFLENRRVRQAACFTHGIAHRILEINLEENPAPASMARRALKLASEHQLALGPRLAAYVVRHASQQSPWIDEALRKRLVAHVESSSSPFELVAQGRIPILL